MKIKAAVAREIHGALTVEDVELAEPRRIARWVLWVLAPFVALFRELLETYYQWDGPFLVDDSRFRARFSGVGVSLSEAVQKTAALAHSEGGTMARAAHA